MKNPRIFVCRDPQADGILDPLCERLGSLGLDVVRGPLPELGKILDYENQDFEEYFGHTDIAMFSSRSRCTRLILESAPYLRAVINPTIGIETIDMTSASELGIIVGNGATPQNYVSMAEAAVMLMLNLSFGLRKTEKILRDSLPKPKPQEIHSNLLRGSKIGIVGLGNIGRTVAKLLRPFDVELVAYSPHADPENLPEGVKLVPLDTLMSECDFVGIFIAVTDQNRHLINRQALGKMKKTAYIVNVSRGDAIDEQALIEALQNRTIAGAALDTFAVEPLPKNSPLRALDNVILTPHLVGQTKKTFEAIPVAAIENIRRVLLDQLPLFCKNPLVEGRWRQRISRLPPLSVPAAFKDLPEAHL